MGGATPMSVPPREDPTKLELRARPAPVTRLNRRTLAVLVGGLAAAVALVTWWAFRPPKPQEAAAQDVPNIEREIGRASCRERECQSVEISVVAGSLKKKKKK